MNRILACLAIASSLWCITCQPANAADHPNIIFIFSDDHCVQALSAYDDSRISTPNMDRIAKEGMRFDRCYVTNGICGPSRAVIQTGKYSHLNGFIRNGNTFNGDQQTFPKLLQQSGYQTAVIGKWHLGSTPQGYDYYDVLKGQGPYYNPPMITADADGKPITKPHVGYTTEIIGDKALKWMEDGRDKNKPFMLMFQHKAPHRNWMPAPKYLNWLDDVEIAEPETLFDDYEGRESPASNQAMSIASDMTDNDLKLTTPRGLTPEQLKTWNAAYAAKNADYLARRDSMTETEIIKWKYQRYAKDYLRCVKSVDDEIGRLLDYLDENDLADNTVVVYSSDQGWYLGEHGWFDKRWMYEESLVTPLLARWPGVIQPGSVNATDITSNLDFAETFLDLAGVEIPDDMQGASLVPLFKGQTPADWRKSFYYHYYEFPGAHSVNRHFGVTDGQHKLIHYYGPNHDGGEIDTWELFDLTRDPNELKSEANNPEYAGIRKRLATELERLREQYDVGEDTQPARKPRPANRKRAKAIN